MPVPIGRPHRPRIGLNGARPLAERWQEAVDLLQRIAPGTPFSTMISELNLDTLNDLIVEKHKAKAKPEPDAATRAAAQEYWALQTQWNSIALEIKNDQRWLESARHQWQHKLLQDISANCFEVPGLFDTSVGRFPFANAMEARLAAKELLPRLQRLHGIRAQISEARRHDTLPAGDRALELIRALVARFTDFETRIEALEAHNMALEARLGRIERSLKPKSKKSSRPTSATRSTKIRKANP